MRVDRRLLNWGVFFILLGGIPLAVQQGLVGGDVAARSWQLWPLLIVAAGIGLLLRSTRVHELAGVLMAVVLGAMLGGIVAVGANLADVASVCGGGSGSMFTPQQGTMSGPSTVNLTFNCGDLTVGTASGAGWSLGGTTDRGEVPTIDQSTSSLLIRSRNDDSLGLFGFGGNRDQWQVTLPDDPTLDLTVTLNAGNGTLGLGGAHLQGLDLTVNAGTVVADLSAATAATLTGTFNAASAKFVLPAANLSGTLQVNAGSVELCAPAGVGLRFTMTDNITASNNYGDQGLVQSGSSWQTAGFDAATTRIDLTTQANAGSFTLNPKDGCR